MKRSRLPTAVVRLDRVTRVHGRGAARVVCLDDVSLRASRGELLLVLGPSGSGKTTLLTLMAGLIRPTSGTVSLFGRSTGDLSRRETQRLRARRIGFVFQSFNLIEALTSLENVELARTFAGATGPRARRECRSALEEMGVDHLAQRFPSTLSHGEKQRVAIARAVAGGAELILADEPTANLESRQALEVIRLLRNYARHARGCVVVASHDLRLVRSADRVVWLADGRLERRAVRAKPHGAESSLPLEQHRG